MRLYAASGGVIFKEPSWWYIPRAFPGINYTLTLMASQYLNSLASVQQVAAPIATLRLFRRNIPTTSIVGGWSLGALHFFIISMQLEACMEGVRAALALDPRTILPLDIKLLGAMGRIVHQGLEYPRAVHMNFAQVPKLRFMTLALHAGCPESELEREAHFQKDRVVNQRRVIYSSAGDDILYFPGSQHDGISVDVYWDIARRLRSFDA